MIIEGGKAARKQRLDASRLKCIPCWKGESYLERIEEGITDARKVWLKTGVSHGNCKCNHWNKNWLSSDVKRKGARWRRARGWTESVETVAELEGDRGEKMYVTVRWIGRKSISASVTLRLDCKYKIAYVYRVNEVYRIPARPTFHSFRNLRWADTLNEIGAKFIRINVAGNYFVRENLANYRRLRQVIYEI